MLSLVADVGGTNTRVSLAQNNLLLCDSTKRYENDAFHSFENLLGVYLETCGGAPIDSCAIAVAGPVTGRSARLTNRDWEIDVAWLRSQTRCHKALLLNDLTALGYALKSLKSNALIPLGPLTNPQAKNAQSLILGIGTGFNACMVVEAGATQIPLAAEAGHAGLPVAVASRLNGLIGPYAQEFKTIESCFSGRGLEKTHERALRCKNLSAGEIIKAAEGAPGGPTDQFLSAYCDMLGALTRSLVLTYLPLNGVYFAGSIARALLSHRRGRTFAAQMAEPYNVNPDLAHIRSFVIDDDFAALTGCVTALVG